jgi:hypothetical protein
MDLEIENHAGVGKGERGSVPGVLGHGCRAAGCFGVVIVAAR